MNQTPRIPICQRDAELVAYLYSELEGADSQEFESHLQACPTCQAELVKLRNIRSIVSAWRTESLGSFEASYHASHGPQGFTELKPNHSAYAALRGFFDLSPLWMKGAVLFASIVLCVLASLGVVRVRDSVRNSMLVKRTPQRSEAQSVVQPNADLSTNSSVATSHQEPTVPNKGPVSTTPANIASQGRNTEDRRRPLDRTERDELATELGLSVPNDDEDLDLLGDRFN